MANLCTHFYPPLAKGGEGGFGDTEMIENSGFIKSHLTPLFQRGELNDEED